MFNRYRDLLSRPGAAAFAFAGLLSRLPGSMTNISLLLMIQMQYDSFAIAGKVTAIGTLAWAAQTAPTARLVDRVGQRAGMIPLVALHVTGVAIAVVTAMNRGPEAWLWFAAILASLTGPLGSLTRARWSYILTNDRDIHTAYSLEGSLDEILFITGPALSAILATQVYPAAGLFVGAIGLLIGMSILLSQRGTEPPPRTVGHTGLGLRIPRVVLAVSLIAFALGLVFGAIDISTVAFADERGVKGMVGLVLGAFSLGSFIGGLVYGSRHWRSSLERRILVIALVAALGLVSVTFMPNLLLFSVAGFFAGSTLAPLIASCDNLVQRTVKKDQITEGLAWLRIGMGIGAAIGAWVAGIIVGRVGYHGGLFFTGGAAALIALVSLLVSPWLGHGLNRRRRVVDVPVEHLPIQPSI